MSEWREILGDWHNLPSNEQTLAFEAAIAENERLRGYNAKNGQDLAEALAEVERLAREKKQERAEAYVEAERLRAENVWLRSHLWDQEALRAYEENGWPDAALEQEEK